MGSNAKLVRGQLRQLLQELLPDLFKEVLIKELRKDIEERLDRVDKHVKAGIQEMNDRSKESQNYVIRNLALATTTQAAAPKAASDSSDTQ